MVNQKRWSLTWEEAADPNTSVKDRKKDEPAISLLMMIAII